MYSNKENVNILTALLVKHHVRHAVVCPGSRNAPIVHNLNECPQIVCHPVTDERSAGFYALGMALHEGAPGAVAVCVTSGTALLNLMPAVAEAYYQHVPLVVISADRPPQWIEQLDGQTLPQPDALGRFVSRAVTLPEPRNEEERWYCNRLVNEALLDSRHHGGTPVHINVPISEPLFEFTVETLPDERMIERVEADMPDMALNHLVRMFMHAKRPMLISGQPMNPGLDEAVYLVKDDERYVPDLVLYTGGSIVSKRLKHFLRKAKETWAVNKTGEVNDTFMNLTQVYQGDGAVVADLIRFHQEQQPHPFVQQWNELLARVRHHAATYQPAYSQMAVVKCFSEAPLSSPEGDTNVQGAAKASPRGGLEGASPSGRFGSGFPLIHYANSTAIRLANIYAQHPVFCNRGVNGIEGSLSTAAGMSVVTDERVYCVIGDLSFFYDQNALWNQNLRGNLRILLLNNGRGGIFNMLPGLEQSLARDRFVAAEHHTTAEGICRQNDVVYLAASDMEQMQQGIDTLLYMESLRPVLLEVFTDPAEDERTLRDYYAQLL
ncbi:MAG: 2-succinyl-5-enolpyruvyl-6-hydroxy-3-cyclohexene-1-carboxylic-acid synthase [Prevotella sp.]|nr:2-succinyl-5-enolpyruvyl-6-hydroxy-3-cyclohexene-1-carboxylic-acid synthase [Prevotella sp.]